MDGEPLFISEKITKQIVEKLAIIGTGIAGMGCGHLLHKKYDITLFEQNNYIGGHTNTIMLDEDGQPIYIDTGFMVFNYQTYPHLCNLFKELNVPVKKSDMSFSVQHTESGLEYCGSGLNGLFAQRKNIFSPRYIRMLMQVARFNKDAVNILDDPKYADYSLGRYIKEFNYGEDMLWKYLAPMSSAVWSTPMEKMLDFSVVTLVRFFKNHGFMGLNTQHQWYTPVNGSQAYRALIIQPFKDKIHINNGAVKVIRQNNKASVTLTDGTTHEFDKVIMASHADQTLRLLDQPTTDEKRLLSPFKYQYNSATLHTDESLMPKNKSVWSSWNYRIENMNGQQVPTTIYWMNRLQQVSKKKNYFVSISAIPDSIDKNKILKVLDYEHPLFDVATSNAQKELYKLNENGPLYYCGSYFRYGFHEDGYMSAVELCKNL